jgi:hypothetical protein
VTPLFRRGRFADVIRRQLALFEQDQADLIAEVQAAERAYDAAARDDAEAKYAEYADLVETATEALADVRDHFARSLADDAATEYEGEFNAAVTKRWRAFGLEIENR